MALNQLKAWRNKKADSLQSKREFFCLMAFKLKHQLFPAFWTQNGMILLALLGLQIANTPCRFVDSLSANSLYRYTKSLNICMCYIYYSGFPGGTSGKESICQCRRHKEAQVWSLVWEDPLEEGIATHSSILAWRIPWTEEPGGLQSKGLQRVKHNWSDSACAHILHMYVLETTLESPLDCKELKPVNFKGNQPWIFIGRTDAEAPVLRPPDAKGQLTEKTLRLGKIEVKRRREWQRMRWLDSIQLNGCEYEQTPGDSGGQGSLVCCSPWGCKELDVTYQLTNNIYYIHTHNPIGSVSSENPNTTSVQITAVS